MTITEMYEYKHTKCTFTLGEHINMYTYRSFNKYYHFLYFIWQDILCMGINVEITVLERNDTDVFL